jgi:hypothetical protein
MQIAFVVARVGDERNVIQRLALVLAEEMRRNYEQVDIVPFSRKSCFDPFFYRKINKKSYDCVLIANVGLQCALCSILKRLSIAKKPFVAFSFGSDIRATENRLINLFNRISKPAIDLLIVLNPDLVDVAKARGYQSVVYVPSWSECLS